MGKRHQKIRSFTDTQTYRHTERQVTDGQKLYVHKRRVLEWRNSNRCSAVLVSWTAQFPFPQSNTEFYPQFLELPDFSNQFLFPLEVHKIRIPTYLVNLQVLWELRLFQISKTYFNVKYQNFWNQTLECVLNETNTGWINKLDPYKLLPSKMTEILVVGVL